MAEARISAASVSLSRECRDFEAEGAPDGTEVKIVLKE